MCIVLDALGVTIPEPAAQIVAGSFTTGFVGRLVLNEFMKAGGNDPSVLDHGVSSAIFRIRQVFFRAMGAQERASRHDWTNSQARTFFKRLGFF